MLNAIGYLVGSRVLDPTRLIGVVGDALLDPQDWSIRQLAVTVGTARLKHVVGLDPQAIHADRPQDPERVKTLTWHPAPPPPDVLPAWPADGRRSASVSPSSTPPGPQRPLQSQPARSEQPATDSPPLATPSGTSFTAPLAMVAAAAARPGDASTDPRAWLPAHTLTGREVQALGHPVGCVQDLVFDDADWRVRYLIVALNERMPTRRRVLVDIDWLDRSARLGADAPADQAVCLTLDATTLRLTPGFEDVGSIDADLTQRLPAPPPPLRAATVPAGG